MKAYRLNENRFLLVSHPHYPSKSTISLPPLSKGGGLTARHKLLSCCVLLATRPPFYSLNFYAVKTEGLLYTHQPLHFHNLLKSTSTASPYAKLASPRKRGGGTAVEVFQLAVQYSDSPAFTILKLSRAVTVGIAPYPHQPSQTRTIPRKPPTPSPP